MINVRLMARMHVLAPLQARTFMPLGSRYSRPMDVSVIEVVFDVYGLIVDVAHLNAHEHVL